MYVEEVWRLIEEWIGLVKSHVMSYRDLMEVPKSLNLPNKVNDVIFSIFLVTLWFVWKDNDHTFNSSPISVHGVVEKVIVNTISRVNFKAKRNDMV